MERGLRDIGIQRMRIWQLGRRLFMLMEPIVATFGPDPDLPRATSGATRASANGRPVALAARARTGAPSRRLWANMEPVFKL